MKAQTKHRIYAALGTAAALPAEDARGSSTFAGPHWWTTFAR
ncbi:hypothetical protein ACFC4G_44490 [Streptomyces sp. NPDC056002]